MVSPSLRYQGFRKSFCCFGFSKATKRERLAKQSTCCESKSVVEDGQLLSPIIWLALCARSAARLGDKQPGFGKLYGGKRANQKRFEKIDRGVVDKRLIIRNITRSASDAPASLVTTRKESFD